MSDQEEQRLGLLAEISADPGPLAYQRRYQKLRLDQPQMTPRQLTETLIDPIRAEEGARFAADLLEKRVKFVTLLDEDYPLMLRQIADPPAVLFYSGELQALHRPCISIVGSRRCTTYGRQVARSLAGELARLGFVIVSGLAAGIDGHAHGAALEVDGRTAAVLGSGIDRIYPTENRDLAARMTSHGAVISEFPPKTPIKPYHFPFRNRIISGLSHATIVVEAKNRSGSLITARHCLEQGRELLAVPGPIHRPTSFGTNRLIHAGEAQLVLSTASVLASLQPLLGLAAAHRERVQQSLPDPLSQKIYQRLDAFEPTPFDLLVAELKIETGDLQARLVELESKGMVERLPGLCFLRNPLQSGISKIGLEGVPQ